MRSGWKTECCVNLYRTHYARCIKKFQLARIYMRWFKNSHFIANMVKEAILETITDFHAVLPETESVFPSLWSASHINKYHCCEMYKQRKSQFTRNLDFTKAFLPLTDLMFQDSLDYEVVKQGFNFRHGEFCLHKFNEEGQLGLFWRPKIQTPGRI